MRALKILAYAAGGLVAYARTRLGRTLVPDAAELP